MPSAIISSKAVHEFLGKTIDLKFRLRKYEGTLQKSKLKIKLIFLEILIIWIFV